MPKQIWEDEARDRFVTFLHETEGSAYRTIAEDVAVENGKNFDYLLEAEQGVQPIALELFRMTPSKGEMERSRVWSEMVGLLKAELIARGVTNYLIRTPLFFVAKPKRREFVRQLADRLSAAIAAHPAEHQLKENGYVITHIPELAEPVFSNIGSAAYFDPVAIAQGVLAAKIGDKNGQLKIEGRRRVVLIVNWQQLVDSDAVLLACSRFDFAPYTNIDQVYFEVSEGKFRLVFDRSLYRRLEDEQVEATDKTNEVLTDLIQVRLIDGDHHAFNVVRKLTGENGTIDWLSRDAQGSLIPIAEGCIEQDDFENALWIIRRLKGHPDPDLRCLLCWPLQKLIAKNKPEFYPELMDILEQYSVDEEERVRSYVPIPLSELAARRRSKNPDGSRFVTPDMAKRIESLAFRMLRDARGEVADHLTSVFANIRAVSSAEALEIVTRLSETVEDTRSWHEVSTMIVYFAIYRERHYPDLGTFDSKPLQGFLRRALSGERNHLRSSLVWTIWKGLKEDIAINDILPYLRAVPDGPFDRSTFNHLYRILVDQFRQGNVTVCDLLEGAIQREVEYLSSSPENQIWHFEDFFECVRQSRQHCGPEMSARLRELLIGIAARIGVSTDYIASLCS